MSFREEMCRARKDNGPQNINALRQIGHNLLKNERTLKVGIQGNRRNAGWDENYLLKVLLGYDAIALAVQPRTSRLATALIAEFIQTLEGLA